MSAIDKYPYKYRRALPTVTTVTTVTARRETGRHTSIRLLHSRWVFVEKISSM